MTPEDRRAPDPNRNGWTPRGDEALPADQTNARTPDPTGDQPAESGPRGISPVITVIAVFFLISAIAAVLRNAI